MTSKIKVNYLMETMLGLLMKNTYSSRRQLAKALGQELGRTVSAQYVSMMVRRAQNLGLLPETTFPPMPQMARDSRR